MIIPHGSEAKRAREESEIALLMRD